MKKVLLLLLVALALSLLATASLASPSQPQPVWKAEFPGYTATPTSLLFTLDGRYLLLDLREKSDNSASKLHCISVEDRRTLWTAAYTRGYVKSGAPLPSSIVVSAKLGYVVAAGMGAYVFDLETGREISVLHRGELVTHVLLGGEKYLLAYYLARGVYLVDLSTWTASELGMAGTAPAPPMPVFVANDGRFLVVEYVGPQLSCYGPDRSKLWSFAPEWQQYTYYLAVGGAAPDLSRILVAAYSTASGRIELYVLDSRGRVVVQRAESSQSVPVSLMSRDASRVLVLCKDRLKALDAQLNELWEAEFSVEYTQDFKLYGDPFLNHILAVDRGRSELVLLDGATGHIVAAVPIELAKLLCAAVSPDGSYIALVLATGEGAELRVYSTSELRVGPPPGSPQPPSAPEQTRFYADWSSLEGWSTYTGWWGSVGTIELASEVYVSPPYSLHVKSSVKEATYVYGEAPGIDFFSPYNVSLSLYLSGDCDGVVVYQDANIKLVIVGNELRVLKSRSPLEWTVVVKLEKKTWYEVTAVVDPTTATATVSVAGVTVETKLPPEGLPTSVETPQGTISWDITLGDLSHSSSQGDFYIDDLEIVQAAGAPGQGGAQPPSGGPSGPFKYKVRLDSYTIRVEKGKPAVVKVHVVLISGAPRQVRLDLLKLGGLPADFPYRFDPPVVVPPATSTLYIDTSSLEGERALMLRAESEGIEVGVIFSLEVLSPFDFKVSVEPSEVKMRQGETATVTVKVSLVKGEGKPVKLSVSGVPSGASYSLEPDVVTPPGTAKLTIEAREAKGRFHVVIKGVSDGKTRIATLELTIEEKKCVIATATYGSELSGIVDFLRDFRDNFVLKTYAGRRFYVAFDAFYYSWSPTVARVVRKTPPLKLALRVLLYPLILSLEASALAAQPLVLLNPELAVFLAGAVASTLIGLVYGAPIVYALLRERKLKRTAQALALTLLASVLASVAAETARADWVLILSTSVYVLSTIALAAIAPTLLMQTRSKQK